MRILYITHCCPYPPNKGDRIRCFHLLRYLSRQYEVTLIYPSFSSFDVEQRELLYQYCKDVYTVRLSSFFSKLRCLFELWNGGPLTLAYFQSKELQKMVDRGSYDLAVADCSSMASYILELSQPKIVDFVDVDSEKWKIYASWASFPLSWIYHLESRRLGIFENEIINRTQSCLVTSEQERQSLSSHDHVVVVPNGIDLDYFNRNLPTSSSENPTLLFMGAMNYFANIDGVLFFYESIFPLIQRMIPEVRFVIAGMNPTKKIQCLAGPNVTVTGFVPDMRKYLSEAMVCVVPLRIARGVQNKVLEAMAMSVAVVSTSAANGGINARDGQEILLADSSEIFADAVVALLKDSELRDLMATRARKFVEEKFSWENSFGMVDRAIANALEVGKSSKV